MPAYTIERIESTSELRRQAAVWDDLWRRAEVTLPTARADLVALWCECFAPGQPFCAWVVQCDGQIVAALPLIERRWAGLQCAALPGNSWSPGGDLLLDRQADPSAVCDVLLTAIRRQAPSLLLCDGVPTGALRWQALRESSDRLRLSQVVARRFCVPVTQIDGNWESYLATRSHSHRRHLRRAVTRADALGEVALVCHERFDPREVARLLQVCFELESRGWKGRTKSAAIGVPGMFDFYLQQAQQLAAWDALRVTLLEYQSQPIAFEYGWCAKHVYCSLKVGYDETFGHLVPGQLLRFYLLQQFHAFEEVRQFDFLGPACPATSKWATAEYTIDRLVIALDGIAGQALVAAYRHLGPWLRTLRGRGRGTRDEGDEVAQGSREVAAELSQPAEMA